MFCSLRRKEIERNSKKDKDGHKERLDLLAAIANCCIVLTIAITYCMLSLRTYKFLNEPWKFESKTSL